MATGKPRGPLTKSEQARIRVLHGEGVSAHGIGKEIGRATSTVTRFAKKDGLSFDTTPTAVATVTHRDRLAQARALLEEEFLNDTAMLRGLLRAAVAEGDARAAKDAIAAATYALNASLKITALSDGKAKEEAAFDVFMDTMFAGAHTAPDQSTTADGLDGA